MATQPATTSLPGCSRPEQLIDGRWVAPRSGAVRTVRSPAHGGVIGEVAAGDARDIDDAVAAARRAFDEGPWPRLSASQRGRYLLRLAALLERDRDAMARLETANNGKPIRESSLIDLPLSVDCF